ncbi:hypothetical protein ACP4OV_011868 [Aristida adscensionis]
MPPPALPDELVDEVLLRVPPDDPARLLRAALACRHWCRLVSGPGRRRRFRARHRRTPPLARPRPQHKRRRRRRRRRGGGGLHRPLRPRVLLLLLPPAPPRAAGPRGLHALDARHGRVLLHNSPWGVEPPDNVLFVWDPITDELQQPPELPAEDPDLYDRPGTRPCSVPPPAASAPAATTSDCHRGPFVVVLVATGRDDTAACVYSSEGGAWSGPTYAQPCQAINGRVDLGLGSSALVGNALYFLLCWTAGILKYNLATQEMSVIPLATAYPSRLVPMAMEGGSLGVAGVDDTALYIWSRKDEEDRWIQSKAIDLKKLLPVDALEGSIYVYGFADGANVIFILANHELYSIDLKSSQTIKIDLGVGPMFYNVFPYMSFYTPALGVASIGEEPKAGG